MKALLQGSNEKQPGGSVGTAIGSAPCGLR